MIMRNYSIIVSLLLLCLLLSEVQGIRLEKGFMSAGELGHHRIQKEEIDSVKTSNGGMEEVILCKDGHCSGNNRKLSSVTTSTTTTTTTSSKNEKINGTNRAHGPSSNEEKGDRQDVEEVNYFTVKSSSSTSDEHREVPNEQYPDVTDLAEMDYSPARRKPPIHN